MILGSMVNIIGSIYMIIKKRMTIFTLIIKKKITTYGTLWENDYGLVLNLHTNRMFNILGEVDGIAKSVKTDK